MHNINASEEKWGKWVRIEWIGYCISFGHLFQDLALHLRNRLLAGGWFSPALLTLQSLKSLPIAAFSSALPSFSSAPRNPFQHLTFIPKHVSNTTHRVQGTPCRKILLSSKQLLTILFLLRYPLLLPNLSHAPPYSCYFFPRRHVGFGKWIGRIISLRPRGHTAIE